MVCFFLITRYLRITFISHECIHECMNLDSPNRKRKFMSCALKSYYNANNAQLSPKLKWYVSQTRRRICEWSIEKWRWEERNGFTHIHTAIHEKKRFVSKFENSFTKLNAPKKKKKKKCRERGEEVQIIYYLFIIQVTFVFSKITHTYRLRFFCPNIHVSFQSGCLA